MANISNAHYIYPLWLDILRFSGLSIEVALRETHKANLGFNRVQGKLLKGKVKFLKAFKVGSKSVIMRNR